MVGNHKYPILKNNLNFDGLINSLKLLKKKKKLRHTLPFFLVDKYVIIVSI